MWRQVILETVLGAPEPTLRRAAAEALRRSTGVRASTVPRLLAGLTDPDTLVREHSCEALLALPQAVLEEALPDILHGLNQLDRPDAHHATVALRVMRDCPSPEFVPVLARIAAAPEPFIRHREANDRYVDAADLLIQIAPDALSPELRRSTVRSLVALAVTTESDRALRCLRRLSTRHRAEIAEAVRLQLAAPADRDFAPAARVLADIGAIDAIAPLAPQIFKAVVSRHAALRQDFAALAPAARTPLLAPLALLSGPLFDAHGAYGSEIVGMLRDTPFAERAEACVSEMNGLHEQESTAESPVDPGRVFTILRVIGNGVAEIMPDLLLYLQPQHPLEVRAAAYSTLQSVDLWPKARLAVMLARQLADDSLADHAPAAQLFASDTGYCRAPSTPRRLAKLFSRIDALSDDERYLVAIGSGERVWTDLGY